MKKVDKISVDELTQMAIEKYKVDRDRWSRLSIFEQMGNIGSEVGRTLKLNR